MIAPDETMCFVVHSAENKVVSYTYRVWARGTSFYLKVRNLRAGLKISIHGPDPRHPRPGLKLGIDESTLDRAHEFALWRFEGPVPLGWFTGAPAGKRARHLLRVRVPWDAMQRGAASGPHPTISKNARLHAKLPAPQILFAADVDFYLSEDGKAYWPDAQAVRRDNSGMGPLRNSAGQLLTAVCTHRSTWGDTMMAEQNRRAQGRSGPCGRTLVVQQDPTGFVWIYERILPTSLMLRYRADEFRRISAGGDPTGLGSPERHPGIASRPTDSSTVP